MDEKDLIRDDMENTRAAISEKLAILEDKVATTVQDATKEVAQTATTVTDSVQDTVQTVKETVDDTLATVKDGVGAVQDLFDISRHVDRYPWAMLGGSVACGFFLGEFLSRHPRRLPRAPSPAPDFEAVRSHASNGQARTENEKPSQPADSNSLLEKIAPELAKLKGLALGALMGTFREMVTHAASANLREPLTEIIDSVTEKIGGTHIPSEPEVTVPSASRESMPTDTERNEDLEACQLSPTR